LILDGGDDVDEEEEEEGQDENYKELLHTTNQRRDQYQLHLQHKSPVSWLVTLKT